MRKDRELGRPREQVEQDLAREWETTRHIHKTFHSLAADNRFHHLGVLFEHIFPWLERALRGITLRHFLLLPKETLAARLFAKAARWRELPMTHEPFYMWVESQVLGGISDPGDESSLGMVDGAHGEPSAELQEKFNRLQWSDRALLYLYLAEGCSLADVSDRLGIPVPTAIRAIRRAWAQVFADSDDIKLPAGWHPPQGPLIDLPDPSESS